MSKRTPARIIKQKARSAANRIYKKAHPYIVKKRSPEATALKMEIKLQKAKQYEKRQKALEALKRK